MGFTYAIGAAITWGLVYAIDQKILSNLSPLTLLFINSILTAILMLPFIFLTENDMAKEILELDRRKVYLVVVSVVLAALANFFIFSGIKHLDASTASIIEISYPFFVVFFSFLIFHTFPNVYFFIGGGLIFSGLFVIIRYSQ